MRQATQTEVEATSEQVDKYGITFTEILDNIGIKVADVTDQDVREINGYFTMLVDEDADKSRFKKLMAEISERHGTTSKDGKSPKSEEDDKQKSTGMSMSTRGNSGTAPGNVYFDASTLVNSRWTPDQVQLIHDMVAKGTSNDEFKVYLYQAWKYELDPLLKEIWAIKFGDEPASIFAAHAGILKKVMKSGLFDGLETRIYWQNGTGDDHTEPKYDGAVIDDVPLWCEATVYRKEVRVSMTFRAYYSTFVKRKRDGTVNKFWKEQPENMLRKCAEANALRKMFPDMLGSLYIPEEMDQEQVS